MQPQFNIAICGGGNLAHGCIAAIGNFNKNFKISMLSRRPELWQDTITGKTKGSSWEHFGDLKGKISLVSNNARDVVHDADIIIICSPAHTKNEILAQIKDHVKDGAMVGSIFGQGAFDFQALKHLGGADLVVKKNITIFCMQYVPFICKAVNYGKEVKIIGPKDQLYIAAYPVDKIHYACNAIGVCFQMACIPVPSYLNLTLCPSN